MKKAILHALPADLKKAIAAVPQAKMVWDDITPLARNEWICWVTIVKKPETRKKRIQRACAELAEGKRRPCCWPGCPHRNAKAEKWFKNS